MINQTYLAEQASQTPAPAPASTPPRPPKAKAKTGPTPAPTLNPVANIVPPGGDPKNPAHYPKELPEGCVELTQTGITTLIPYSTSPQYVVPTINKHTNAFQWRNYNACATLCDVCINSNGPPHKRKHGHQECESCQCKGHLNYFCRQAKVGNKATALK